MSRDKATPATITPKSLLALPVTFLICALVLVALVQMRSGPKTNRGTAVTTIQKLNGELKGTGIHITIPDHQLIDPDVTENLLEIFRDTYLDQFVDLTTATYWHFGYLKKRRIDIKIADFNEMHLPEKGGHLFLYLDGKIPSKDRIHRQLQRIIGLSKTYLALNFTTDTIKPQDLLLQDLPDEDFDYLLNNLGSLYIRANILGLNQIRFTREDFQDRHLNVLEVDVTKPGLPNVHSFLEQELEPKKQRAQTH